MPPYEITQPPHTRHPGKIRSTDSLTVSMGARQLVLSEAEVDFFIQPISMDAFATC
jgi:hypothetical protein